MKALLVVAWLSFFAFLFYCSFSMFRYKSKVNPLEQERLSKGLFPWWYYLFGTLGIILALNGLDDWVSLAGIVVMLIVAGCGWRWKVKKG
ncbi:hypothetical protein [Geobacter sp. AOG1]|uniref:hypothetical protein n=1 Tax=Geobacter sp. AOG1 TaxID=1566346 RepID=UPI001CC47006|nr:hypothetical protein [Geobacter sp. AOG1]GFE57699.1 hypothetical protein AOG1_15790 [Geobacter sp. AOG1]